MAKDPMTEGMSGTDTGESQAAHDARENVRMAAEEVKGALEGVREAVPEVARTSRTMLDDAMRRIENGSDERISAGVTLSLGLALGMLLGGAPRLLTALALVPVAAIGMVMMDRRARGTSGSRAGRSGAGA
jgi:hypothetical protein